MNSYIRSKSKSKPIQSFDPQVLEDELIAVLERSPQTSKYVQNRVKQIIAQIMSTPIIAQLQAVIQQLEATIYNLQEDNETLNQNFSKEHGKNKNTLLKYAQKNRQLSKQIIQLKQIQEEKNTLMQQIQQVQRENQQLKEQIKIHIRNNEQTEAELRRQRNLRQRYEKQLEELKIKLNTKQEYLNKLTNEQDRIKKISKETKYNQIKYKKQCQTYQQQTQELTFQLSKAMQDLRNQKNHRQNERKVFHLKITQLQKKTKNMNKISKKMKILSNAKQQLSKQLDNLRVLLKSNMKKINQEVKQKCYLIMDEIGDQVNKELAELMSQMSRNNAQIRILREQVRIKDEIAHKLQKASSVQLMGNKELQRQLKSKKVEADSLRKQLKRNYEQTQIKYMGLEHSYRQILASSINFPIR